MFQQLLNSLKLNTDTDEPNRQSVEQLTALLLIEVARSDTTIDDAELSTIRQALNASSVSMDDAEIDEIINSATQDADTAVSLHEQIRQINSEFSREQKLLLVEQMWVVAMADGDLDKYEEHMIRTLTSLMHVTHAEFIQAKLKVQGA